MTRVEDRVAELLSAAVPESGGVSFDDVARRVRRRRAVRWSVLGSAATVAALAAVLATAGGPATGHSSRPATRPSADRSGAIPWTDAPAPDLPAPTGSSEPAPATDARSCTAADVTASIAARGNGASGHQLFAVTFRNTSQSTCVLTGYPHVTATEPGRPSVVGTDGTYFPTGRSANMAPGHTSLLGLSTDFDCSARTNDGGRVDYHHFVVDLPGGGTVSLQQSTGLDLTCGLRLTKFFVPESDPSPPHNPLTELRATLDMPATTRPGATLAYVVRLNNPTTHAISLMPCPGYIESAPSPALIKELYALNCASVGTIAAGHTVRFQMRIHIPTDTATGQLTIRWELATAEGKVASATVTVAATPPPSGSGRIASARPCDAADLTAATAGGGAAMSHVALAIRFLNHSGSACQLKGWPEVTGVSSRATSQATHIRADAALTNDKVLGLPVVTLSPGSSAYLVVTGSNLATIITNTRDTCPPAFHTLRITLPGSNNVFTIRPFPPAGFPSCSQISTTPIVASGAVIPEVR